ncbi:acyltransferase family protein [Ekhidna sp.]|jgi:glucan biosynthesis protein C|uniref:acyltransferase family protein n=1 Tax=Ekhidna sp. TaxID=2608089 RepID=UPI0032EE13C8
MERRHDIDWLRVIAIILVLYFHTAMIFTAEWDWHIKNDELSYLWLEFNFWLSRFRMPLLFFISGYGTYLALRKRSPWRYLKERHNRLMVPLIFAMIVIVPPQVFFERLFNGATMSYASFWPTIFEMKPYPEGNLSWHHMWFVLYLFIYSAILLPVFLWLRKDKVKNYLNQLIEKHSWISYVLLIVPTVLIYVTFTVYTNRTNALIGDWGWMTYWGSFFLAGYFAGITPAMWKRIESDTRNLVGLALLSTTILNYFRWNRIELEGISETLYLILLAVSGWLWLLSMLSLGKRYLNKPHPILAYANRAIYPFYILHQTIIIIIGYYIVTLVDEGILAKYLFVSTISFILSVAGYEYFIRPFRIMRFLFGVKELPKKEKQKDFAKLEERAEFKAA